MPATPNPRRPVTINNQADTVGIILTTFNDRPLLETMVPSLVASMPDRYQYAILAVDAGSTDGTIEYLQSQGIRSYGPHLPAHVWDWPTGYLSQALNSSIKLYLYYDEDTQKFRAKGYVGYLAWVHADMVFHEQGWLGKLVDILKADPTIGKLGPDNHDAPALPPEQRLRAGNQCPWIMPVDALMALWEKDGMFFDEQFVHCGGYEDWDLNRRLIGLGRKVLIANDVRITHQGMGSRTQEHAETRGYHDAGRINAGLYQNKWGDGKPPC